MQNSSNGTWLSRREESLQPLIVFLLVGFLFSRISDPIPPLRDFIEDAGLSEFQFKLLLNAPFYITLLIFSIIDNKIFIKGFIIVYVLVDMLLLYSYIFRLVETMSLFRGKEGAYVLMTDVVVSWFINVILFGLLYWILDPGSSFNRRIKSPETIEMLFPQYSMNTPASKEWYPNIIDYIALSFFTSTTFGPTDTMFLTRKLKTLMVIQVMASLTILTVLATRAVTLIK